MPIRTLARFAILAAAVAWAVSVLIRADLPLAWSTLCRTASAGSRWPLLALFLVPSLLMQCLDTKGWISAAGADRPRVSFWKLLAIRLAGESVNQGTPLLGVGGEPLKAWLVATHGNSGLANDAAAVLGARLSMTLGQVGYVAVGTAAALVAAPSGGRTFVALAVFPAAIGVVILLAFALVSLFPGALRPRFAAGSRLSRLEPGLQVAVQALGALRAHPVSFAAATLYFFVGWVVAAGEFWVVSRLMGRPLSVEHCFVMEALVNSITMATFFIPANLGSQEAGVLYVARLYGLGTPAGGVMIVLRRLREVFWIAAGAACLAWLTGGARRPKYAESLEGAPEPAAAPSV